MRRKLSENLKRIEGRIAEACRRSKRDPARVRLIAVTKSAPLEVIRHLVELGVRDLGENRVQEAAAKIPELDAIAGEHQVQWHLIGHLQSNKARRAVELFDVVQSIDSLKLAERLDNIAGEFDQRLPAFIEVNLGGEESKSGVAPDQVLRLCEQVGKFANLELKGLMAVPPFSENPEDARPFFQRLRQLRDEARDTGIAGPDFKDLSMGMSGDFEVAIEEGATFVRIGTALFGARV